MDQGGVYCGIGANGGDDGDIGDWGRGEAGYVQCNETYSKVGG